MMANIEEHLIQSNQSNALGQLAKAMAKVQEEMPAAPKDSTNPFFKSKFASLESCMATAFPFLSKNGLTVVQTTDTRDGRVVLNTTLIHSTGEWIRGVYPVLSKDNTPQALGSAISYAKRYSFSAIIGQPTGDDDGEAAQDRPTQTKTTAKPYKAKATIFKSVTEREIAELRAVIIKAGWGSDQVGMYLDGLGKKHTKELTLPEYTRMLEVVSAQIKTKTADGTPV